MSVAMTPRERMLRALAFEETDLVPYDVRIDPASLPKLVDYFGDPDFARPIVNHLPAFPTETMREWLGPDRYVDAFGCCWRVGNIPHIEEHPLKSPSVHGYQFPDLADDGYFQNVESFFSDYKDRLTFCVDAHGFYDRGWAMRGMEDFFADLVLHPAFVEELLEALTELHLRLVDRIATYPFDGIRFADDWGFQRGVVIGAARWRKFIKPGLKRIFDRARDKGLIVMVHSCGDVTELLPDLIDMGVQIFNPLQPEAMDALEVKRRYGRHLCLNGGISTQHTLPRGTAQEVSAEVAACLRYLGKDGGYVASPAKPILRDVPPANAAVLIDALINQSAQPAGPGPLPARVPELWQVYGAYHP